MESTLIETCSRVIQKSKFIGRNKELSQIIEVLNRKNKNNIVLIGNSGVGKTSIVERLASLSKDNQIPYFRKLFYLLEVTSLMSNTKYRGELEQKLGPMVDELKKENGILFIDNLEIIMQSTTEDNSVADFIKPRIRTGDLQCIATCTIDQWLKQKNDNPGFTSLFQEVYIRDTSYEETYEILRGIKHEFEAFHNITISDELIGEIVSLSGKYISNKSFPDKAIDVLDQVGASTKISSVRIDIDLTDLKKQREEFIKKAFYSEAIELNDKIKNLETQEVSTKLEVESGTIKKVIEKLTGIPISNLEKGDLDNLNKLISIVKSEVIGQDEAIEKIIRSIQKQRLGIGKNNKPVSFLFIGSTGVGKTELAKCIANHYFGNDKFLRLDMSEFKEESSISSLIGSSVGYMNSDSGGRLTNFVSTNPFCVILLDEVEKAHPLIYDLFLQVLDDGILTDKKGNTVNFKNTVILMSSNIGVKQTKDKGPGVGFIKQDSKQDISKYLYNYFRPEFINRIDEIVYFNQLTKESLYDIVKLRLDELVYRCSTKGFVVKIDSSAKDTLVEKGYNPEMGARPLNREIAELEKLIAEDYLNYRNNIFNISSNNNTLTIESHVLSHSK